MKVSTPPGLAYWLLKRSGADAAIVGDIIEEYARGRTAAWFWKQALFASVQTGSLRRISVARIVSMVLIICGGLFAFMSPLLGFGLRGIELFLGALVVLGGTFRYLSSSAMKKILWREISLDWLGGLTRPPVCKDQLDLRKT